MKAAIYVRVSTDQQAEKGYSIATQLDACRKYAVTLGATSIEEFVDDGYSGEFIDRPALTKLREKLARKEFQTVISYAPDRLSRNTIHLLIISEEIVKAGALRKFASINFEATPEGELMYKFQGIVAEYEKEKIKERTMRGKRGKAAKGLVISNTRPFGYLFDAANSTYKINETEADIVRMIFDFLLTEKMGTARICKELNARGIPSPRAKKAWIVSSVHRILSNTLYKGIIYSMKYRYQKIGLNKKKRTLRPEAEWIPVYVPAIIDEVTWQAAKDQLQANKSLAKRNIKQTYLLNGLVICAVCGRAMIISHSGCQKRISYYACLSQKSISSTYAGHKPCSARQVPTELLEEYVFKYLFELLYKSGDIAAYLEMHAEDQDLQKNKTALAQISKAAQDLQQQKNAVIRWFRQKILSASEIEYQLADISKQLADILELKSAYETKLSVSAANRAVETTAALELLVSAKNFTTEEKRSALRAIVDKVIVKRVDNTRGRGSCPEINVQLTLKGLAH
ncbi:MAG: recombinase family protein [Pelosinus sp.]|nr:recombinase family protein [Pelosinus sp.]